MKRKQISDLPRPLFPQHVTPPPTPARIGWTKSERNEAECFLLSLENATAQRVTQTENKAA
ncbi:MAG: hypothetical protein IVW57_15850 [Ktedonobacterales bacterium]|nr:hypothetical protein [Ktedonobacterales bacterium]